MTNFYQSREWKETRLIALEKCGSKCERCGNENAILLVHHKIPRKDGGSDSIDNLKVVCKSCHLKEHMDRNRNEYRCVPETTGGWWKYYE